MKFILIFAIVVFISTCKCHAFKISPMAESVLRDKRAKMWVYFDTKMNGDEIYKNVMKEFSIKTLNRRKNNQKIRGDDILSIQDLPINADYILKVLSKTSSHDYVESLWLNAISISLSHDEAKNIAKLSFVSRIEPVLSFRKVPVTDNVEKSDISHSESSQRNYGESAGQLSQINVQKVHEMGYTGKGVTVLIIDSGFRRNHVSLVNTTVLKTWDFINNIEDVDNQQGGNEKQFWHGTRVFSLIGGKHDGSFYGVAPDAKFLLAKTENLDIEDPIEEDYFVKAVEWGEKLGAQIISSSLGYSQWYKQSDFDGKTAVTSKIINYAVSRGIICVIANGNEGEKGINAPADAFYSLSVGAVDSTGLVSFYSFILIDWII